MRIKKIEKRKQKKMILRTILRIMMCKMKAQQRKVAIDLKSKSVLDKTNLVI